MYFYRCVGGYHEWQVVLDVLSFEGERRHVFITARKCCIAMASSNLYLRRWRRSCLSSLSIKAYSTRTYCKVSLLPTFATWSSLTSNVTSSVEIENLFVKGVHFLHLSVLYINQNVYCKGKHSPTSNLNTHIYVLMKNPRDVSQL